jgi:beta-lactamase regulating signal transducer with metallopeptidase domain/WD40 repeat protein
MNAKFLSLLFSTTLAGVVLVSLVDAAAKSFVLLLLAVVVCLTLRRASAATRHLIWFSTLGAALALPVLSLCVPQWRVLPEWMDVTGGGRNAEPFVAAFPPIPTLPANPQTEPLPPGDVFAPADQLPPMDAATEQALKSLSEAGVDPQQALIGGLFGLGWLVAVGVAALVAIGLLLVWGIGAVVLLLPMVRSAWSLRRLARSLPPVTDGPVAAATANIARELCVQPPLLYLGSAGAMPMVWGVRRGRLLLPAEATEWDAVRLRAVLLHELAHLRRRDPLTQAIAQVARALHWFNPLAWLALRNLRVEQERACDDYVLRGGVNPSDYAGHVLELATTLQPAPRAVSLALAMADRTRIEGRLHTILDAARDRRSVSRWLATVTMLIAGSVALSLAMLQSADGENGDAAAATDGEPQKKDNDKPAAAAADQQDAPRQGIRNFPTAARVGTIACSADGKLVAVANDGPTFNMQVGGKRTVVDGWRPSVEILSAVTGKSVVSLKLTTADEDAVLAQTERVPDFEVRALAFSPDASVLAVGTTVGQIKLFNARTGEVVQSLDDGQGKLADTKTPERLKSLTRAMGSVASLAFSPDGSLLAVCGESFADVPLVWENVRRLTRKVTGPGRLEVWEVKTGTLKHDLIGHSHALAVAFSPNGNSLASAGPWTDGNSWSTGVILWNPQAGAKLRTISKQSNGMTRSVAFSPDGKSVAFSSVFQDQDGDGGATAISLAQVGTGNVEWQHTIPASAQPMGFFSMSVWVLCDGKSLRFLRPADGTLQGVVGISAADSPGRWNALATAKRDGLFALGGVDDEGKGQVQIWDVSSDSAPVKRGQTDTRTEKPPAEKLDRPAATVPKQESGRSLFKRWQNSARTDGKIPGGALRSLADAVARFIRLNPTHEAATKLSGLLKRIDTSHDWTQADAVALLDDVTAIYDTLPDWAGAEPGSAIGRPIRRGEPLPAELAGAAWGQPAANGLRAAWVFDPDAGQHPFGTALKSRILFHNTGKETVIFQTPDWHQYSNHEARDANGAAIPVPATEWTRLPTQESIRLAPGEFAEAEEVHAIVIGPRKPVQDKENWRRLRLGEWIETKEGDEITFLPAAIDANGNLFAGPPDRKTAAEMWQAIVKERIDREGPMPASAADREQLIRRVMPDLLGVSPTQQEIAAFVADNSPDALAALVERLVPRVAPFAGALPAGEIKFRVTAADPVAAKPAAAPAVKSAPPEKPAADKRTTEKYGTSKQFAIRRDLAPGLEVPVLSVKVWAEREATVDMGYSTANPRSFLPKSVIEKAGAKIVGRIDLEKDDPQSLMLLALSGANRANQKVFDIARIDGWDLGVGPRGGVTEVLVLSDGEPKIGMVGTEWARSVRRGDAGFIHAAAGPVLYFGRINLKQPGDVPEIEVVPADKLPPGVSAPPAAAIPKDKHAQELFKLWQAAARSDGRIPGGLIAQLRAKVEEFIRLNRDDTFGAPHAKKVEPILPRFHDHHDWLRDLAVTLLDDLASLSTIPIETTLWADAERRIQSGQPLPADLKDAPWGEPTAEGLRAARPLDPRAPSYPLGTALRSRVLLHNAGKEPLLVRAKSWMQPGYAARDAASNPLNVEATYWTTLGRVETRRLAPGEFIEIATPGLGVGKDAGRDEWADVRVGSWIEVAADVDVTLSPGSINTFINDGRPSKPADGRELKLEIIRERLERERPLPASAADRELIVRRVTKDIFGGEPTADEISAFVTDKSDDPFTTLADRLLRRPGLVGFIGAVKPGEITFRTRPADPEAANRPKVAIGPGRYSLDKNVRLIIVGKPVDGRRTSDVEIRFWGEKATGEPPGPPHKIEVPDGFGTWAFTCRPGTGVLWLLTKGAVRKIDYSNPGQVKETSITRGSRDDMPDEFREAVKRILTISNVPAEQITALMEGSAPDE